MPDQKQLDKLNAQLNIEVRKAFEFTQQLQNAQLDDAEVRIAASRKRLETRQRLADSVVARRIEELMTISPDNVSPQAVIGAMERFGREKDFKRLVGLLTDDEANRYGGMLIQSVSMTATMTGIAQESDSTHGADVGPYAAMQQTLAKFMKQDPPKEAAAALEELSTTVMSSFFSQVGAQIDGKPVQKSSLSVNELSDRMRKSAGVLTDARGFVAELLTRVAEFSRNDQPAGAVEDSDWTFEISGDTAVARRSQPTSNVINSPEIKLQSIRGEWRISQLGTDDDLLKFSTGPTASVSSPPTAMQAPGPYRPTPSPEQTPPYISRPVARPEPLYQSVTRSEWQSRFANETEPATRIEAAQALVALAARDNAEERFERCMTLGAELMESGFGKNASRYVLEIDRQPPSGFQHTRWVYQNFGELGGKWSALLNQADAALATVPPRQLAEMLIKETNHDSLPRAAFTALLLEQNRIVNMLKQDDNARKLIVGELIRSADRPLRYALLRTQARFYDRMKDGGDDVAKSFLDRFREAGEELAAKPVNDDLTFALARSWLDLQKRHAFATQDLAARVVLRMLIFDEGSTRRVVLLYESDRSQSLRTFAGQMHADPVQIGESIRSEWIAAVNEYLKTQIEADPRKVSPAVVGTINEFIRTQTQNEKWNTAETARLLTPLLEKYFDPGPQGAKDSSSPLAGQMSPHNLLSTILHCGGEIPRSVIDGVSSHSFGPFEPAYKASPFQFLKSSIESANLAGDLNQYALPDGMDVLTLLAVAVEFTGVSKEQDQKIAAFVELNAGRSLEGGLSQKIAAAPAWKFLKRIESKT